MAAVNWKFPGPTRSGREVKPTFKVRALIRQTVTKAMKELNDLLEDSEHQIRAAMRDCRPTGEVDGLYQNWVVVQQEFVESEGEYIKLLSDEETKNHRAMFKRKLDLQGRLVEDVERYTRASKVVGIGAVPKASASLCAERARLEREIKEIESKLSASHLSAGDSSAAGDDDLSPPHSTPKPDQVSYLSASSPSYHPDIYVTRDRLPPVSSIQPSPVQGPADPLSRLVSLLESNHRDRLPQLEPEIFDGDLMEFADWMGAFETLVEHKTSAPGDLLFYLGKYTKGEAKQCISGMLRVRTIESYRRAKATLVSRFGDKFKVAEAYRRKLFNWPTIRKGEGKKLLVFTDYLWQCHASLSGIGHLTALNSPEEIVKILKVVPSHLTERWDRFVDRWCYAGAPDYSSAEITEERGYPPFLELCKFLSQEARVANGPGKSLTAEDGGRAARVLETETDEVFVHASRADGNSVSPKCFFCKADHWIPDCRDFMKKSGDDRRAFAREMGLCYGCLRRSHIYRDCRNRDPSLLADETVPAGRATTLRTQLSGVADAAAGESEAGHCSSVVLVHLSHGTRPEVSVPVYALLDSQSDSCFVEDAVFEQLGISATDVDLRLTTMGSSKQVRSKRVTGLSITGVGEKTSVALPKCYTRGEIPSSREAIARREDVARWSHLKSVAREMPDYQADVPVGMLIGFNCPSVFIPRGCAEDGDAKPFGVMTSLGWCVMGAVGKKNQLETVVHKTLAREVRRVEFAQAFDIEFKTLPEDDNLESQNERIFRARVADSLHQTEDGHYEMDLPFKEEPINVPNNRELAMRRLMQLKKKMIRDEEYAEKYRVFMNEMVKSGYAEEAPTTYQEGQVLFSPHHGVEHPLKPGTIRPVFDAQAEYRGVSLNSLLLPGSEDPNSLAGVLCNFRDEKVGFMCDIKSMFYQVRVSAKHRDFLRYLWFRNGDPKGEVVEFRMCVHIFGATSSPSCANVAFRRNADDAVGEFSDDVIQFIRRQFYVDDGLNSRATVKEVVKLFKESHELCKRGGFWLCKFTCNEVAAIAQIPDELLGKKVLCWKISGKDCPTETSLGLIWSLSDDAFMFVVKEMLKAMTRRGLLSGLSGIYDPLGLISPVILVGRLILQELCVGQIAWDEPVPEEVARRWTVWHEELKNLAELRIPRCIRTLTTGRDVKVTLHHFGDASTRGYGVCSYAVLEDADNNRDVALIYSKSRVAPKKPVTMPRMELQAAVLAVKSAVFLEKELLYDNITHRFWSDSRVVLGYILNSERRFHMYVANRVAFVREHSAPDDWRYVSTESNPADLTSRGSSAAELVRNELWWAGPAFISSEMEPEVTDCGEVLENDPEVKKAATLVLKTAAAEEAGLLELVRRFSCWYRAVRVLARCLWFGRHLRARAGLARAENTLSVLLLGEVETLIVKRVQELSFAEERDVLLSCDEGGAKPGEDRVRTRRLKEASCLFRLDVFLDNRGIVRVGGRLRNADLPYEVRHPVLLPKRHFITELIVRSRHIRSGHLGRLTTLAQLREDGYWVISGRAEVDRCTRRCVTCKRLKGRGETQKMADLPADRTEDAPPFTYVGADVFGPYLIKERRAEKKRWVVMFTCLTIRAVQLEPLHSMSADSFLHAFRRLINRRGPVRMIRCDCGTNFIGAQGELKTAFTSEESTRIHDELLAEHCDYTEFKFNVPKASHMGGVWERPIGTAKKIISSILLESPGRLNDETFSTFLAEAEGAVNGRPITCVDEGDPLSEPPLCPGNLLTLKRGTVTALPGRFPPEDLYSRKEWRRVQSLREQFMTRWRREYLLALQKRQKWEQPGRNLKRGDVVLLMEDGIGRGAWPLAIVAELYPSSDDLVRKVAVRTASGRYDRPITKVVYLLSPDDPLALPGDLTDDV